MMLDHVATICRNRVSGSPRCGKCAETGHETKDCVKRKESYKCSHCDRNHETGAKDCEVMKLKLEEIKYRIPNA